MTLDEFLDGSLGDSYETVERGETSVKATGYAHSASSEDVAASNVSTTEDPASESDVTISNVPMANGAMADIASSNDVTGSEFSCVALPTCSRLNQQTTRVLT